MLLFNCKLLNNSKKRFKNKNINKKSKLKLNMKSRPLTSKSKNLRMKKP
jgi:hypothetical protein